MLLKIAFQMESMDEVDVRENNTFILMWEAFRRGHEVYHYQPQDVALLDGQVIANITQIEVHESGYKSLNNRKKTDLSEMDVIMFRQDPPVDMEYITNTFMLERLADKVLLVNNPYWIRNATDKLYPFDFPEFMPPTLVTSDMVMMENFHAQHGDIVVKPLYGYHGHGIERYRVGEKIENSNQETLLLQPFIPEITQGNKRIVLLNGEIAGAIITQPSSGEFKIYRNSVDLPYQLNERDLEICNHIGRKFKERGLIFVGVDIIGDYLTEINLGSVGSILRLNEVYDMKFEQKVWAAIEESYISQFSS